MAIYPYEATIDVKKWLYDNIREEAVGCGFDVVPDEEDLGIEDGNGCIAVHGWVIHETSKAVLIGIDTFEGTYAEEQNKAWQCWIPRSQIWDIRAA